MDTQPNDSSPPWNRNVKTIVTVMTVLLIALVLWQFSALIRYLVIAGILSFLLGPIINLIERYFQIKRVAATLTVYLTLLVVLLLATAGLGIAGFNIAEQVPGFINNTIPELLTQLTDWLNTQSQNDFNIGPFGPYRLPSAAAINWTDVQGDVLALLQDSVSRIIETGGSAIRWLSGSAISIVSLAANFLLIFAMSIYINLDAPRLENIIGDVTDATGYRADAQRLFREIGRIWRAYLRGQIILGIVIFFIVWLVLMALGVSNAFSLGVLSGILEFLPMIGPVVGAGAAVLVAVFQDPNWMGLSGWQLGLLIMVVMLIIQQLENNILVPRIVGNAIDLHPLVTMVVVLMGASAAGILGAILAAPVAATLLLIGRYTWRKLFDLPPFPAPEREPEPVTIPGMSRLRSLLTPSGRKKQS